MTDLHEDELAIDDSLVRALIKESLPEAAGAPLRRLETTGSTNALFRLGDDLVVRLPRRPGGSAEIEKEERWSAYLQPNLSTPIPEVVLVGEPAHGFPEPWSVVRWLDGATPEPPAPGEERGLLANDLAAFVGGLRETPVPPEAREDTTLNGYRAKPLHTMDAQIRSDLLACRELPGLDLDLDAAEQLWERTLALPAPEPRNCWLHSDLLAENVLTAGGRLAAVLDLGALAVGDPTADLMVAWDLLGPADRAMFRDRLGVDDPTWARGRAWALALALITFPYYWRTMPERCASRLTLARAVLADADTE